MDFQKIDAKDAESCINQGTEVKDNDALRRTFEKRAEGINDTLAAYVRYKEDSYNQLIKLQKSFFWFAIVLLGFITIAFIVGMVFALSLRSVSELITAIISFATTYIASVFAILHIIAKYLFPDGGISQETDFLKVITEYKE